MSDWEDDFSGPSGTGGGGVADPLVKTEYERMEQRYTDAGYREGITDGKLQTLQEGFDSAFASSVPSSRRIGQLRGRVNALLSIATSSSPPEVLSEVRQIAAELGAVRRDEVLPPDQERIAHEEEHGEVDEVINPTDQREMEGLEAALSGLGGKKDGLREEALIEDLERRVGEVEKKVLHL